MESIREWRAANPSVCIDLREANLSWAKFGAAFIPNADHSGGHFCGVDLSGATLGGANLFAACLPFANLSGANLSGAFLRQADLNLANLSGANLTWAYLPFANLTGANLTSANLSGANLMRANLGGAVLTEANLSGVNFSGGFIDGGFHNSIMAGTIFSNVDLSRARGLETVRHMGPSTIGIDTIYKSRGRIPETFLRGCGVPDALIAYVPSLLGCARILFVLHQLQP